jgi:hypothetical protein
VKKDELKARIEELETRVEESGKENGRLTQELEQMRKHWRPVPITHAWQPRDPRCALCDESRDSPRHQTQERAM